MRSTIRAAILAEANAAKAVIDVAEKEERDLTDVERDTIDGHMKKAAELTANSKREDEFRAQVKDVSSGLQVGETPDQLLERRGEKNAPDGMTLGERFAKSKEYTDLLQTVPNGLFSEKSRVHSQPMGLTSGMKALFYSGNQTQSAGPLVYSDRRGMLDPFYERPLTIRNLFAAGSTQSDTIEYVRMVSTTNNAAPVPEATTTAPIDGTVVTDAMGGLKPESGFTFQRDSTTVKTIAHWIPITKRALADAAQIRSMIDSFLRYGLEEQFEDELLLGDGTGEHLLGLMNTAGIQTQPSAGSVDNFDITRKARTKVRIGGRARPTAYVLNPVDWEKIELLRNANENFYGNGPFGMTTPSLWGLPVVESEAMPAGTGFCAAWNWGMVYDREQASIQVTDSHADFFVRNLVAVLSEMRAGFTVLRPPAFVKMTLL